MQISVIASGMSRLAALILACGQRKCNAGQRIIELIRHRLAAVHADHVLPRSARAYPPHCQDLLRPRVRRLRPHSRTRPAVVPGFSGPPWGPLPKAPPQASLLRVPAPLLPRILLRRFFLFFGFLLFEGLLVLRFRFVRILIQRAVVQMRAGRAADRAVRVPGCFLYRRCRRCRRKLRSLHPPPEPEPAAYSTPYCKAASGRAVVFHRVLPFLSRSSVPRERACQRALHVDIIHMQGSTPWLPIPDPAGSDR